MREVTTEALASPSRRSQTDTHTLTKVVVRGRKVVRFYAKVGRWSINKGTPVEEEKEDERTE